MTALLDIKNLHLSVGEKEILKGVDLTIRPGEVL
jgi:Fe-S cluster assembly ATP-binding protein